MEGEGEKAMEREREGVRVRKSVNVKPRTQPFAACLADCDHLADMDFFMTCLADDKTERKEAFSSS